LQGIPHIIGIIIDFLIVVFSYGLDDRRHRKQTFLNHKRTLQSRRIVYGDATGIAPEPAREAYNKTIALVSEFSDEVAWHGTVTRSAENEFIIEDIFVYPQEVTGSTVNTDRKEYSKWLYGLGDDIFSKIRMQGHSHVNMGVTPSGVDDSHRRQILEQLERDMFYIFMVWNKSLSIHTLVYDMENNILYENKDVDVRLLSDENIVDFIADAKKKVRKATVVKKGKKAEKIESELTLLECSDYPFPFDYYDLGGEAWF
jgi:hypothetical protein